MFTAVYIQRNLTQLCYVFVYMFKETCPSFNLLNVKKEAPEVKGESDFMPARLAFRLCRP